ncbi:MAG: ribonuclease III domain-containing protein [Bacilli bacterium]|nr:ribonuclease III domain-containing protein [Bacilli bacterium]
MIDYKNKNILVLAYLGDAIYEVYVRKFLIGKGDKKVDSLQKEAIKYVSAKKQREYLEVIMDSNFFSDIELEIIGRARNHKGNRHPKNTDIVTYKYATALEAVIGYLYLTDKKRLDVLISDYIINR